MTRRFLVAFALGVFAILSLTPRAAAPIPVAILDGESGGPYHDWRHVTPVLKKIGKGRVFHTTWGHDIAALSSIDFVVTLQRGTEWAATGRVTQKVPLNFPTAETVSYRADLAAMDPDYTNGLDNLDLPVPRR